MLLDLFNNMPPTAEQARFTAIAANAAGDVADSYYYMSEYHVISGDLSLAINQLRLAQAVPGINAVQRERFDARVRELQEYLPKGKRAREVAEPQGPDSERRRRKLELRPVPTARDLQMTVMIRAVAGALLACLLAGCATTNMGTPGDPLERMNRATHKLQRRRRPRRAEAGGERLPQARAGTGAGTASTTSSKTSRSRRRSSTTCCSSRSRTR